jgi:hypothetical protein
MDGTGQDGARLHISGLFVGFVTGLPQLLFPVLALNLCNAARGFFSSPRN